MVKAATQITRDAVFAALDRVPDPEIPAVSVTEMGMIGSIEIDVDRVKVTVLPTFTGCPAVDVIRKDVHDAVLGVPGVRAVEVSLSFDPPWTVERISAPARKKLRNFGLAPPGEGPVLITEIGLPRVAECPFCGSRDTVNENPFGPTPCRALYYCRACRNPFEQFKPI